MFQRACSQTRLCWCTAWGSRSGPPGAPRWWPRQDGAGNAPFFAEGGDHDDAMTVDEHMQVRAQQSCWHFCLQVGDCRGHNPRCASHRYNRLLMALCPKPRPTCICCRTSAQMVFMLMCPYDFLTSDIRQVPELVSEPSLTDHEDDSDSGLGGMPPLRRARLSQPLAPPSPTPATHVRKPLSCTIAN